MLPLEEHINSCEADQDLLGVHEAGAGGHCQTARAQQGLSPNSFRATSIHAGAGRGSNYNMKVAKVMVKMVENDFALDPGVGGIFRELLALRNNDQSTYHPQSKWQSQTR